MTHTCPKGWIVRIALGWAAPGLPEARQRMSQTNTCDVCAEGSFRLLQGILVWSVVSGGTTQCSPDPTVACDSTVDEFHLCST